MSNRSNESRRIFPFNICTISHICTTEFAVDSFSPLTTRFSLTLFTWVSPPAAVAFPPKSLDEYEKCTTRCSLFSLCGNFRLFLGKRRQELCANNCKIIKMTGRHGGCAAACGCTGVCGSVCRCVSGCSRLLSFNYTKVIWCKKRNKCVCVRRQQTENVLNPHTKKKKVTPRWAPNLMLQRLRTDERRWRRQQSAFNCAWKCWRNKNNNSNNAWGLDCWNSTTDRKGEWKGREKGR